MGAGRDGHHRDGHHPAALACWIRTLAGSSNASVVPGAVTSTVTVGTGVVVGAVVDGLAAEGPPPPPTLHPLAARSIAPAAAMAGALRNISSSNGAP